MEVGVAMLNPALIRTEAYSLFVVLLTTADLSIQRKHVRSYQLITVSTAAV